ncbi:CmpA/NrtA family ABC transporter substrate-binding protein [Sneathiella aquimaris]|uniref:CmpA/NrtA family ABC transporter substrate-binding protein n=1 Tax=Sneathiella aquimaris TaxID=2599305 RepID=UPI00146A16D1|nr:CmpA/NrtA family ABC transporter substrate-binding protein [Sneathiella aquimaris]
MNNNKQQNTICAGFLPLMDAAILIATKEKGFGSAEGIDLVLVKESSWANIRDRMAIGHFDVAHMLAPMPIASALGLMPLPLKIIAPMAMGLGGNAITISLTIANEMASDQTLADLSARDAGKRLSDLIVARQKTKKERLVFGVVHPYSGHNYELRYWLAACGIHPDKDVDIVVIPPALMPDALSCGMLDGFCVGEPWNSIAIEQGVGTLLTTKSKIWRNSPEKVLGASESFATQHPEKLAALIRALYRAAKWCSDPANIPELSAILSTNQYIGVPPHILEKALLGKFKTETGQFGDIQDFFIPYERAATFPWLSHALWFYSQMVRWGHADWSPEFVEQLKNCYRPDLYRSALSKMNVPIPSANAKVEGALEQTQYVGTMQGQLSLGPDGFFDGRVFDPDDLAAYIEQQRTDQ